MSSEQANYCTQGREETIRRNQTVKEEDIKFDPFLVSTSMCENQIDGDRHKISDTHNYYCSGKDMAFSSYPIKKEAEGLDLNWHLPVENDSLKEEIDIEEHKPEWDLMGGTGSNVRLAEGDFVVSAVNFKCSSGSKRGEQVVKYNCAHCPYKTNLRSNFIKHYKCVHIQYTKVYRCNECPYQTGNRVNFLRHFKCQHSKNELHKCDECSYETNIRRKLTSHHRIQHAKDAVVYNKCEECSFQTKYKSVLIRHYKLKHLKVATVYRCVECSYETRIKGRFAKHHKIRHSEEAAVVYKCQECSFETTRKHIVNRHHRIQHTKEGEVYNCEECSYETRYKNHFTRHKMKHSKERTVYKCDQCSCKTKYKSDLTRHYKVKHSKHK